MSQPNASSAQSLTPQVFSAEQKKKLNQIIQDGINVLEEIDSLKAGLKDTIDAVAEELEIRSAILQKAVKIARKSNFDDHQYDLDQVDNILKTVGRR
jgi:hypothetical protein